jgi:hypothetical protein
MAAVATLSAPSHDRLVQQTFDWECVAKPPVRSSRPRVQPTPSARQGRCEHVGGMMATVLAKYGITAEEFRATVEELRASRK